MTGTRIFWIPMAVAVVAVALLGQLGIARADQPEITESNVENGDVLDSPPEMFHLCFSEPVNNEDAPAGPTDPADLPWAFSVQQPDGSPLGLRIEFRPDGSCVDVVPGLPPEPPEGDWVFNWMVRSQSTDDQASGVITFQVGEAEDPDTGSGSDDDDGIGTSLLIGIGAGLGAALVVTGIVAIVSRRRRVSGRGAAE